MKVNEIQNCPVMVEDIELALKIFDSGMIGVKDNRVIKDTVKHKINDEVKTLPELKHKYKYVELCMDMMSINNKVMLTMIDKTIKFRSLAPLNRIRSDKCFRSLDLIARHYNKAGFIITTIHYEGKFKSLMNKNENKLEVIMNYVDTSEHVMKARQNVCEIMELMKAGYQSLPFKT